MSNKRLFYGFALAGLAAVCIFLSLSGKIPAYGSSDSISYIEAARNLRAGKGLTISAFGVYPVDRDTAPLREWAPGYSLLIASMSAFNIDEKTAAIIIPKFFFLLLPFAFFLVLRFMLHDTIAFASAVIITFMWPTVAFSMMAMSDIPFLFISLISFYLLFKAIADNRYRYGFMAGASGALAILIRYVGYNLFFATVIGLLLSLFMKKISREKYLRTQIGYLYGFSLIYLPMMLRNIFTFHSLQPYKMPPESMPLFAPAVKCLKELACIFIGIWPYHLAYIAGSIFLLLAAAYCLKQKRIIEYCKKNPLKSTYFIIFLSYLVITALLFSIGSLYLHNYIEFRMFIPHYWIIAAFLICSVAFCCGQMERFFNFKKKSTILILIIIFFMTQFCALQTWIGRQKVYIDTMTDLKNSTHLTDSICAMPQDAYIISNCGPLLRWLTERNVRKIARQNVDLTPTDLADLVCRTRTLYVILVYRPGISEILPKSWLSINSKTIPKGYQCLSNNGTIIVLRHDKLT